VETATHSGHLDRYPIEFIEQEIGGILMGTDKVNRGLTLAANVGVLGGLILVAFQINQYTQITKAQITNDYYFADMQLELAMMGDNPASSWTKAVYTPNDLTNEDAVVVDRYFNYRLLANEGESIYGHSRICGRYGLLVFGNCAGFSL